MGQFEKKGVQLSIEKKHIFEKERDKFPAINNSVYLQCGSTGPIPEYVYEAVQKYQSDRYQQGGDSEWDGMSFLEMMETSKKCLAGMLNCKSDDIAFGLNSSSMANIFVQGLNLKPGDNVILTEDVFVSGRFAWQFASMKGIELRFLPAKDGCVNPKDIEAVMDSRTKIVYLCYVESASGFRFDVEKIGEICQNHGAIFAVDAVQAVGALKVDVAKQHIDFLVGNDYKWMLSFGGCGFAYVSEKMRCLLPAQGAGWMSDYDRFDTEKKQFQQRNDAGKYELGFPNVAGIRCLGLVAKRYLELGAEEIEAQIMDMVAYLYKRVEDLKKVKLLYQFAPQNRAGIVYLEINSDCGITKESLYEKGIRVDGYPHGEKYYIRISVHYYTNQTDIDRLVEALDI